MTVLLYLLPLGLIFDLVGYMPPSLRLFLLAALLALPLCLRPSRQSAWLAWWLMLVMLVRALLPLPQIAEMALLLLIHHAIWTAMAPVPRPLSSGVVVYAFLHWFLFASPLGHPFIEAFAVAGNRVSEWITGNPYHIGFTWQNIGALLLFALLSVFSWDGSRIAMLRSAIFVVAAALLNALASALLIDQVNFGADFVWDLKFRDPSGIKELGERAKALVLLSYPAFLFLAYLAGYLTLHYARGGGGGGAWRRPVGRP